MRSTEGPEKEPKRIGEHQRRIELKPDQTRIGERFAKDEVGIGEGLGNDSGRSREKPQKRLEKDPRRSKKQSRRTRDGAEEEGRV